MIFHKNVSYLIIYQWTKFQCHTLFLSQDIKQNVLRRAYTMKLFFHGWLNFSFGSFLSIFNTCIQLRNVNEIFQSMIMKLFQKKQILPDFC